MDKDELEDDNGRQYRPGRRIADRVIYRDLDEVRQTVYGVGGDGGLVKDVQRIAAKVDRLYVMALTATLTFIAAGAGVVLTLLTQG